VKDEDMCLHCGLCAERCPTGAWDMQKFLLDIALADDRCHAQQGSTKAAKIVDRSQASLMASPAE